MTHLIFLLSRSRFNIKIIRIKYWPNLFQNQKCSKVIEIQPSWYFKSWFSILILNSKINFMKYLPQISYKIKNAQNFKYADFNLNVKNNHEIFTTWRPKLVPKVTAIWYTWYFKYNDIYFNFKNTSCKYFLSNSNFYQISINSEHFWDHFGIFFRISFRMLFPMI